jgi:ribosomal-protein-alanine N-acetyltransferase
VLSRTHAFGFDTPWSVGDIEALFAGVGLFAFLAEDDGRSVGMLLLRVIMEDAEILTIAVDPAVRGRGVGRALVRAALDRAPAAGATAVFLEVAVDNTPALALYERAGFRRAGLRTGYYDRGVAGPVDAFAMRLDLPGASA